MQNEDSRLSTTGGGAYLPRASNQWEANLPIAKTRRLKEINDVEVIRRVSSTSLHSNHQRHHVWQQIGDAGCSGIVIAIVIAIAIVKAINEHTIAIVDPSTWKTHTISIHPSLVDEFLIKLKLDKRRKSKNRKSRFPPAFWTLLRNIC